MAVTPLGQRCLKGADESGLSVSLIFTVKMSSTHSPGFLFSAVVIGVLVFGFLPVGVNAFGAGDIPDFSYLNGER